MKPRPARFVDNRLKQRVVQVDTVRGPFSAASRTGWTGRLSRPGSWAVRRPPFRPAELLGAGVRAGAAPEETGKGRVQPARGLVHSGGDRTGRGRMQRPRSRGKGAYSPGGAGTGDWCSPGGDGKGVGVAPVETEKERVQPERR